MTEAQVEEKKRADRKRELSVACSEVFNGKNGKLVYDWLEGLCGWNASTIRNFDPIDPLQVVFLEGRRDVFGRIMELFNEEVKDA